MYSLLCSSSRACRLRGNMRWGTNVSHERCSLPEYSVSFMTEFHEVKCPDHMGRVAGFGKILIRVALEFPQVGNSGPSFMEFDYSNKV